MATSTNWRSPEEQKRQDAANQALHEALAAKNADEGGGASLTTPSNPSTSSYKSPYSNQIDDLLNQVLNPKPDNYDYNTDPMYLSLKDTYTRNGKTAMQDTVGQIAARTGGMASSYAGSAGTQAYNAFMQKLNDTVPQLEQNHYSRTRDAKNDLLSQLGLLTGLDETSYGRYRDTVGDSQYNQTRADNLAQLDLENRAAGAQWENTLTQQGIENKRYDAQYGDSRNDANFNKAQTLIQMGFSTAEIARALGVTEAQAQEYAGMVQGSMQADIAAKNRSNQGSGGGSSGKPKLTAAQTLAAIKAGTVTPDVKAAYEYYYGVQYQENTGEAGLTNTSSVSQLVSGFNADIRQFGLTQEDIATQLAEYVDANLLTWEDVQSILSQLDF